MTKKKPELNFEEAVLGPESKNSRQVEVPLSLGSYIVAFIGACLLISLALGRVIYLNVSKGSFYQRRSEANFNKEFILPPLRGVITDRYGKVLAKNTASFSVYVNVAELLKPGNEIKLTSVADKLSGILNIPEEDLITSIKSSDIEHQSSILIERGIDLNEAIAIRGLNLEEVAVVDDYIREYPDGPIFSHVIGYTGLSDQNNFVEGKAGLERFYDDLLRGEPGLVIGYRNAKGEVFEKQVIAEPKAGSSLATTIDADLHRVFYHRLKAGLSALGRNSGVGIAMNPQNGEILALISLPSFDNNVFASKGNNQHKLRLLNDANQPLFNRAISGVYTPGSTIKPLVALAALQENIINPILEVFSRGYIEIPNPYNPDEPSRFVDWKPHGWVNLHSALAKSSNIYFYGIGGGLPRSESEIVRGPSTFTNSLEGLGIYKLKEYWDKLGFGKKTGIDLIGENSGLLPDPEYKERQVGDIWRLGDTYNVSIGQGDLMLTPLQLVNFISSIANGGKIYRPHIAADVKEEVFVDYSKWGENIKEVQTGMEHAVSKYYGTAVMLSELPISAAGKTGSAQVANNTRTNAFFVGYAPADNPQIAILVLVENSREGSLNAVPIAKDVLEWYYYNRIINLEKGAE